MAAAGVDGVGGEDARANHARAVHGGAPDGDFRVGAVPPTARPCGPDLLALAEDHLAEGQLSVARLRQVLFR